MPIKSGPAGVGFTTGREPAPARCMRAATSRSVVADSAVSSTIAITCWTSAAMPASRAATRPGYETTPTRIPSATMGSWRTRASRITWRASSRRAAGDSEIQCRRMTRSTGRLGNHSVGLMAGDVCSARASSAAPLGSACGERRGDASRARTRRVPPWGCPSCAKVSQSRHFVPPPAARNRSSLRAKWHAICSTGWLP